jgi:pimeloyl-ACP methyl ester carboxylesterase
MKTEFTPRLAILPDTSLPFVEKGEGPPLVFMHGILGDWRTWSPVLRHIPEGVRAIAFTQRWFGADLRDHGRAQFGTRQQSGDLRCFLDALGIPAAHIVAWSFSAHSALAAAVRSPDRVLSLSLYDLGFPTFVSDTHVRAEIAAQSGRMFQPVIDATQRGDSHGAVREVIDASGGPGYFDRQPAERRRVHLENANSIDLIFGQTPPEEISASDLSGIRIPTRIAWGEFSGVYRTVSKAAAALIPDCEVCEIAGANHLWPEMSPAAFTAFATSILQKRMRTNDAGAS